MPSSRQEYFRGNVRRRAWIETPVLAGTAAGLIPPPGFTVLDLKRWLDDGALRALR